jgi:hypothetical protein
MPSQTELDSRIRDRAYQIWLSEGRGHGRHEAHWQQAEREIDAEETGPAGKKDPARAPRTKQAAVTSGAAPPTVSRARAKDEAAAKQTRTRAAAAAGADRPATVARSNPTSRRRDSAKT